MNAPVVVPLFTVADGEVARYLRDFQSELNTMSSNKLAIGYCTELNEKNATAAASVIESERYPGIVESSFPCIWVEAPDGHFILPLKNDFEYVKTAFRVLTSEAPKAVTIKELEDQVMAKLHPTPTSGPQVPAWFAVGGFTAMGIAILFLISLVVASVMGHPITDKGTKVLVVFVIALCVALGTAFLTGDQSAKGNLPVPFLKDKPLTISATGGVAAFVIVIVIAYSAYI